MTWQNALFVVAGVTLMGLLEWGHSRLDEAWEASESRTQRLIIMSLAAALLVVVGLVIIGIALYNNNHP